MAYTDIDKPDEYFNTVLYTGNNTGQSITGVGFQPDWVWIKDRDGTERHVLNDVVRGVFKELRSNETAAESDRSSFGGLSSFDSDGFTIGNDDAYNDASSSQVSWNWLANGAGVSNTAGDITSTVSASTTSGFSIVSYTGNATSGATVGHGLGAVPKMIIVKKRNGATNWTIYNSNLSTGASSYLYLNTTDAEGTSYAGYWNSTTPTSSVFTLGNAGDTNGNTDTYIAYCFAEKKGFSKFGSYTGNGSADGTFVYTGFKPAWVLAKRTNDSSGWVLFDNKREPFNLADTSIRVDDSGAENQSNGALDFLSNGFKWRTTDTGVNGSGNSFIFMAFAENPFVTSTSIPTTAR
jgi:hypothetical protein